jgi:hypothetical protein
MHKRTIRSMSCGPTAYEGMKAKRKLPFVCAPEAKKLIIFQLLPWM